MPTSSFSSFAVDAVAAGLKEVVVTAVKVKVAAGGLKELVNRSHGGSLWVGLFFLFSTWISISYVAGTIQSCMHFSRASLSKILVDLCDPPPHNINNIQNYFFMLEHKGS
jgi:hypothetical protein